MDLIKNFSHYIQKTESLRAYRTAFSEASAVGFLSAILFTVFSDPVRNVFDFGEKWVGLSGLPYQMNTAFLGFVVGFGLVRILLWLRCQILKMLLNYHGWMTNPKSTTTKMWALMLNAIRGWGNFSLYFFQPLLPHLPVPDLNTSCDKYLAAMRPVLTDDEFMSLLTSVISFKEKEGQELQKYLLQRAYTEANWLSEYWLKYAYLIHRTPLAVNVNCYAIDRLVQPSTDQVARAANMMHYALRFYQTIVTEELTPQYLQDMIPMCMEQYKRMYCTVREPHVNVDKLVTHSSRHIIIMRRGVYFKLDIYSVDNDGKETVLTVQEIHSILQQIMNMTEDTADCCRIAALTSQKRDIWAKQRAQLLGNSVNKKSIDDLESCVMVFCLDDESPKSEDELAASLMTGNGINRWFDKSLLFSTFANGLVGVNAEHASADATIPGRMWEYFLTSEKYKNGKIEVEKNIRRKRLPVPEKLEWDIEDFEQQIDTALEEFKKLVESFDLRIVSPDYGKRVIKKKKLSPDGYIQMALQLAYYRLHNRIPKTYESATTRMFAGGRTETIRPVSEYSVQWVKSMQSEKATREQRVMLLRKAVQYQTQVKIDASCGMGWDRHLLGLFAISQELQIPPPALFIDKAFWKLDLLSTSQTPSQFTKQWRLDSCCIGGGFFPPALEGYGVAYMIVGEDIIKFHVTSNQNCSTTSAAKMGDNIVEAMADMQELLSWA